MATGEVDLMGEVGVVVFLSGGWTLAPRRNWKNGDNDNQFVQRNIRGTPEFPPKTAYSRPTSLFQLELQLEERFLFLFLFSSFFPQKEKKKKKEKLKKWCPQRGGNVWSSPQSALSKRRFLFFFFLFLFFSFLFFFFFFFFWRPKFSIFFLSLSFFFFFLPFLKKK